MLGPGFDKIAGRVEFMEGSALLADAVIGDNFWRDLTLNGQAPLTMLQRLALCQQVL